MFVRTRLFCALRHIKIKTFPKPKTNEPSGGRARATIVMSDTNLIKLTRRNLLAATMAAIDSRIFTHLYVRKANTGEEVDVTQDGQLSCAFFVSSMLTMAQLIDRPHAVVANVVKAMEDNEWEKITEPRPGAVITWPESVDGHAHIGIVVTKDSCVSHTFKGRRPQKHGFALYDGREPVAFYWHANLEDPSE